MNTKKGFYDLLGLGLLIFLACLGLGGCLLMEAHADKIKAETERTEKP